uniref:Ribosomal protein S10 n=1 Tax=Panagrolaimus sp. JU765 TaxID=591449 RepID=A0AC34QST5_9BILA
MSSRKVVFQIRNFATLRSKAPKINPKSLYEPEFKDPKIYPEYPVLNIRLQSYDFVPLERFQGYVDRMAKKFKFKTEESYAVAAQTTLVKTFKPNSTIPDSEIETEENYAVAAQTTLVKTFKPNSTIPDSEIEVSKYDRTVRLSGIPSVRLPLFLDLIQTHAPIGIEMTIKVHEKSDEDYRYIPDLLLKEKQEELKALDDPNVRKNLGWE